MSHFRVFVLFIGLFYPFVCIVSQQAIYKLIWSDEFDGDGKLDPHKWKFSNSNKMCRDCDLVTYKKNGVLILRAMLNPDQSDTTKKYIAGCIETKDLKTFGYGKLEISKVQGSWPAIWLLALHPEYYGSWPKSGEIDIMEHLNNDPFVYHTIHSRNMHINNKNNPPWIKSTPVNINEFNIYGMIWTEDSITLYVNNKETFVYPRIKEMGSNQWPYNYGFYLILNQILGGWAGEINDSELPSLFEIDWVRYYKFAN